MIDPEFLRDRPGEGTLGRNAEAALTDAGNRILGSLRYAVEHMRHTEERVLLLTLHDQFVQIWTDALALRTPRQ